MDKTITDYSRETARYSQWRVLKTKQIAEFLKLALAPKVHNAPKPKMHRSNETQNACSIMIIALIITALISLPLLISRGAYETVIVFALACIVTLVLMISFLKKLSKDKVLYKKRLAHHKATKKMLESYDPEQIKDQFAHLGEQADTIAVELGVALTDLEALRGNAGIKQGSRDLADYRRAVELIEKEYELVYNAYVKGRPDPFMDSALATSPEGAKKKQEDFSLYALAFSYVEGHLGYIGAQPIWYTDPDQVKLREHYKELKVVK